jgi:hypothetical protein
MVNCAHAQEKTSPAKSHEKQESDQAAKRESLCAWSEGYTQTQGYRH